MRLFRMARTQGIVHRIEDDDHVFAFPEGWSLPSEAYLVVCQDSGRFSGICPCVCNYLGSLDFGLGGKDQVRLYQATGHLVDSVAYADEAPWPDSADGLGYSLERIALSGDLARAQWAVSYQVGGTPGEARHRVPDTAVPDSPGGVPTQFELAQNYPNPFNAETRITYSLPERGTVCISLYNLLGQKVATPLPSCMQDAGTHTLALNLSAQASGIYFCRLAFESATGKKHSLIKKMAYVE